MLRCCAWSLVLVALLLPPLTAKEAEKHPLPIVRVVLFTSGVAYIEHRGEVDGNQSIDFQFHVDDVNDLLKSMVVQDHGGGRIETVTYAPQEPLSVQLGDLRIDPSQVRCLGDLLELLRGEKVSVDVVPKPLSGTIVALDRQRIQVGEKQTIEQETLLLKTETGLRNVPLASVAAVQLLDEALDRDLQRALELLAGNGAAEKKQVSLRLRGAGKRQVRVGYIQEFPVWKTSYRLVLDAKENPLLQGWAIVENTTDHDWENVQVSLVSGRPVSFMMDLYQPLFLARPTVVPELFAGLHPKRHAQDLSEAEEMFRRAARNAPQMGGGLGGFGGGGFGGGGGGVGGGGLGGGGGAFGGGAAAADNDPFGAAIDPKPSVKVAAQGAHVGTFFRYAVEHPVTLASQRSAMLPIVNDEVTVERKAVFNTDTDPKHPMTAIELLNSTKLHLMQGPITVFDGGEYAGDAQIADIAPQSKRLVTYAMDLNIEVAGSTARETPEEITAIRIHNGYVTATKYQERKRVYIVKNSNADAREVLLEQDIDMDWKLLTPPRATEQTAALYRFALAAAPGKPAQLEVVEQRETDKSIELATRSTFGVIKAADVDREAAFNLARSAKKISPAVRDALAQWREKHQAIAKTDAQITALSARVDEIGREQSRIRQNLAEIPKESELYRKYLTTLSEQEDELDKLRAERMKLGDVLAAQRTGLDTFLIELDVE